MGYDPAPAWLSWLLNGLLRARALFHRHVALPRLFTPIRRTDDNNADAHLEI